MLLIAANRNQLEVEFFMSFGWQIFRFAWTKIEFVLDNEMLIMQFRLVYEMCLFVY